MAGTALALARGGEAGGGRRRGRRSAGAALVHDATYDGGGGGPGRRRRLLPLLTVSSVESDTITTYRSQTLSCGTTSSRDRWFGSVEELGQFLGC